MYFLPSHVKCTIAAQLADAAALASGERVGCVYILHSAERFHFMYHADSIAVSAMERRLHPMLVVVVHCALHPVLAANNRHRTR